MPTSGGKKQSQRTKGNLKPSSSSQAAELLVNQGTAQSTGFIGFGQGPKYVPASETLDDMDTSLDSDFRMVLRKLTKRDSITKIKSLQELSEICGIKEEDSIKAVLPFWPRIYNKMTMDIDYRVREAAQHAMSTLVKKAGRNVAPYLKSMMGAWLLNQCDTYPTVASAAQLAFTNSFSPHKQKDVWSFSKDNILEYLSDNILKQTPQTLSDPKATDPEDMENKYVRVVTCSLLAVKKLLQSLPTEQVGALSDQLKQILEDPKFWKHGKHKVNMVKGAVYGCISGICQSQPELCENYVNKMAPLVFHNLDEKDPVICSNLWEAVLSLVNYLPACWQHINVQKGFMPKLKNVLENGCHGNAVVIGPSLLPFISKVPPDLLQDSDRFIEDFFTHFKTGLSVSTVQTNRSECNALVRAYMESTQYVVVKETTSVTFLADHVLPLVESSLLEDKSQLYKTPLYSMVSRLLGPATIPGTAEFWNHLAGTTLDALDNAMRSAVQSTKQRTSDTLHEKLLSLVRALYYPDLESNQKSGKVTFQMDEDIDKSLSELKLTDSSQKVNLGQHSANFVHKLVQHTFKSAHKNSNSDSLQLLSAILDIDSNNEVVSGMVQCVTDDSRTEHINDRVNTGDSIENENNNSVHERETMHDLDFSAEYFVSDICVKWIIRLQNQENFERDMANVMNMISLFMKNLDKEKISQLLVKLNEVLSNIEGFAILLSKLLTSTENNPAVQDWVRGPAFGSRLVGIAEETCNAGKVADRTRIEKVWTVVSLALGSARKAELLISEEAVEGILQAVLKKLSLLDWKTDSVYRDVKHIATAMQTYFSQQACLKSSSSIELLIQLFSISISREQQLTGEANELLQTVWSSGFSCVFKDKDNPVRVAEVWSRAAEIVTSFVNKSLNSSLVLKGLLGSVKELISVMLDSSDSIDIFTVCCQLFVELSTQVPNEIWEYLCVRGVYPAVPKKGNPCISWTRVLYTTLYNGHLLETARSLGQQGCQDSSEEGSFWNREVLEYMVKCFQGSAIVEMSLEATGQTLPSAVSEASKTLKELLSSLVESMDKVTSTDLWELVLATCDRGPDLCLAVTAALNTRADRPFIVELSQVADRCSNLTASACYLVHSCLPYLTAADRHTISQILTAQVLSWSPEQEVFSGNTGILSLIAKSAGQIVDQFESESEEMLLGTLDQILVVKDTREEIFLYSSNLSESEATKILLNADMARFLSSVVEIVSEKLTDKHWDFIMCSLASWVQSLEESRPSLLTSAAIEAFAVSICNLVVTILKCIGNIKPGGGYPSNLVTEWNEFFGESVFSAILPIYVEVCGALKTQTKTGGDSILLTALCSAVSYTPKQRILEHGLPPLFIVDDTSSLPDELQTLVNHIGPLMLHKNRATQISAWHILNRIIGDLPQYDKEDKDSTEEITSDHQEPTARGPPLFLLKVIDDCAEALHDLLEDTEIEHHRTINPEEAGYHQTLAYLLSWQLIVNFFTSAPPQIRQEHARYLEDHHLVEILMWSLYKLMPAAPDKMFEFTPDMTVIDAPSAIEIQHLSCNLYKLVLKNMPAMVRKWWKNCDRKTAAYVDKLTTKNVSNLLCVQEIQSVQSTGKQVDGMTVKTRPTTREVIATYCLGEVTIEMVITLPPNYPLGPISVKSEKRVGVTAQQWEKWLLQLNIFLQHQNGNIIDGLELWKNNVDKKFEGVDDCMICFSVLHGTNFQLPRITCKTCKKKFHSACLYKWFNTSHNSTCPLCRNVF